MPETIGVDPEALRADVRDKYKDVALHPEAEMGEPAAAATVLEASITLGLQPYCGHVLAVAARK